MRVVHISYSDSTFGACIAAYRIHRAVLAAGADSVFVCQRKTTDDPTVQAWPKSWFARQRIACLRAATIRVLRLFAIPDCKMNLASTGIDAYVASLAPDVVHLHWINADTISLREVARLARFPLVWSLHDLWPCGATEYHFADNRFEVGYGRESHWLERWYWRRKWENWKNVYPWLVGPSAWAASEAGRALLWRGRAHVSSIPYPLDLRHFFPRPQAEARQRWDLPTSGNVLLFGCIGGTRSSIKGFPMLREALGRLDPALRRDLRLVVFGEEPGLLEPIHGIPVNSVGIMRTAEDLNWLYAAADVFAFPSPKETFGLTKIEALASGTPVVAFNATACADGLSHLQNAWIAEAFDVRQYARGLEYFLRMKTERPSDWAALRTTCATTGGSRYDPVTIGAAWMRLYQDAMAGGRKPDDGTGTSQGRVPTDPPTSFGDGSCPKLTESEGATK